jgi:hypothetical protein
MKKLSRKNRKKLDEEKSSKTRKSILFDFSAAAEKSIVHAKSCRKDLLAVSFFCPRKKTKKM